ncbi:Lactocepin [Lentilactobacillus otakiensis DSM 19908 = JCM 15040]|uniref:S8 family serine peptidase n=1 Tax=Lentilactobacillus otakiensis TaxID=481720 RepID=UPI000427D22A|nr:S8 family serine peptidase [Lentilactobacillus otakiensis]KRL11468.1 Lactocepin [Lentilactobacillus otakiensis DSM 19908 = JCM 15040]
MIDIRKVIAVLLVSGAAGLVSVDNVQTASAKSTPTTTKKASSQPANQNALDKGSVPGLWAQGYRGQGMVVAVIDSGIQANKEFTLSDTSTAAISKTQAEQMIAKKGYGKYISPKIPFAYDYVNNNNDDSPADTVSGFHGLMTSGIVGANGSALQGKSKYVEGIAPEAQLLNMKVYGGFSDEWPNDVARAIHDAVDLGANVINMSLGLGIPNQSLTDQEQAAVKYATDHGVFVAVAGSNYGHAGSAQNSYNEQSNTLITIYEPANTGTTSNPAASPTATTVGDENAKAGDKSEMDEMSAWGPTPEFNLKPDISAPGQQVAVLNENNTFTTDTGTSFSSPYIAGSAALILQKLKQTQPALKGAALVNAVKIALMNAAQPMANDKYKGDLISPRVQGAGQVNVTNAADLKGAAFDPTTNQGSISLKSIGQTSKFNVAVTNHSDTDQTYHVNTSNGPFTEVRDTNKHGVGPVHDTPISGASLQSDQSDVTVAPGKTQNVQLTLNLGNSAVKNSIAEGYISFVNSDASQNLTVPYFGYYGDPTEEPAVDKPANEHVSVFNGGYLMDTKDMPLGLSDRTSLASWLNTLSNPDALRMNVPEQIQNNKVAFSPNGDGHSDAISPYVFTFQNLADVTAEITNASGKVIHTIDTETNTQKSIQENGNGFVNDLSISPSMRLNPKAMNWNGMAYDQSTGRMKVVPDGQYHYVINTTNYNDGAKKQQSFSLPFKVDTIAPKITKTAYKKGNLAVSYSDVGAGFTSISSLAVKIGGKSVGVSLNNNGKSNSGKLVYKLSTKTQKALAKAKGKMQLSLADVAGNQISKTYKAKASQYKHTSKSKAKGSKVTWTVRTNDLPSMMNHDPFAVTTRFAETNGIKFTGLNDNNLTLINATSKVYNSDTNQLTIAGKVSNPKAKLTILKSSNQNASENKVKIRKSGKFSFEMPLAPTTQRGIGYILQTTKKGKTTTAKGTLEVMIDTTPPTLNLSLGSDVQEVGDGNYTINTNESTFNVAGSVDDNVDGYRLFINSDNIFHEQNNAGFVDHTDIGANPNPHSAHQFSQSYNLQLGKNVLTVSAVDQTGNKVTKTITVTRQ